MHKSKRINLFVNYYEDKNSARKKELEFCLAHNTKNPYIDKVVVIKNERPSFNDFFKLTEAYPNDFNIIANSDVIFDETITLLKDYNWNRKTVFGLTVWDLQKDGKLIFRNRRDSQDVFITLGAFPQCEGAHFGLGKLGCDNSILHKLEKAGFDILNPSMDIKCAHIHLTQVKNYNPNQKSEACPEPYKLIEPTSLGLKLKEKEQKKEPVSIQNVTIVPESIPVVIKSRPKIFHIGLSADGTPYNGLQRALMKVGEYKEINTNHPNLNNEIKTIAQLYKPDLTFIQVQTADIISFDAIKELKKNGSYVVNWTGDVRFPLPEWYIDMGKLIDNTLFTNLTDVETARARGIKSEYLQIGIDETIYTPQGSTMYVPEIVFLGNNYNGMFPLSNMRSDMIQQLRGRYGNKFGVFGNGYSNANGNFNHSQEAEARVYRTAKIAINLSHFSYKKYSSDRLFRILGTGKALCLSHRFPLMEEDFVDGYHLRSWGEISQLFSLIDYYLSPANDEERIRIATQGRELCHSKFTWDAMINNLMDIYKKG